MISLECLHRRKLIFAVDEVGELTDLTARHNHLLRTGSFAYANRWNNEQYEYNSYCIKDQTIMIIDIFVRVVNGDIGEPTPTCLNPLLYPGRCYTRFTFLSFPMSRAPPYSQLTGSPVSSTSNLIPPSPSPSVRGAPSIRSSRSGIVRSVSFSFSVFLTHNISKNSPYEAAINRSASLKSSVSDKVLVPLRPIKTL